MITTRIGNLLTDDKVNVIIHQCNCHHTMGGGIARIISKIYPEAAEADRETIKGDREKMGTFSVAKTKDGKYILNVYSQYNMSSGERETSYDALCQALESIEKRIRSNQSGRKFVLGVPYGMGSDLARGSWTVVNAIITSVFAESPVELHIVRLPDAKELK